MIAGPVLDLFLVWLLHTIQYHEFLKKQSLEIAKIDICLGVSSKQSAVLSKNVDKCFVTYAYNTFRDKYKKYTKSWEKRCFVYRRNKESIDVETI